MTCALSNGLMSAGLRGGVGVGKLRLSMGMRKDRQGAVCRVQRSALVTSELSVMGETWSNLTGHPNSLH